VDKTNSEVLAGVMRELGIEVLECQDWQRTLPIAQTLAPFFKALLDKIDNLEHDLETAKLRSVATGLGVANTAEVNVRALNERIAGLRESLDVEVKHRIGDDNDLEDRIERLEAGMATGPMSEGQDLRPQAAGCGVVDEEPSDLTPEMWERLKRHAGVDSPVFCGPRHPDHGTLAAPPQEVPPGVRAFEAIEAERLARLMEIQKEALANRQKQQEDRYARQQKRDALLERVASTLERFVNEWGGGQTKEEP